MYSLAALRAVLFDLDGTLIDSEPVWGAAMRAVAAARGDVVTDDLLRRLSGLDARLAMELVHAELGWPAAAFEDDLERIQQRVRASFRAGLAWLPGAQELLTEVRRTAGVATGLVTSTYRPIVDVVLSLVGTDLFDVVVCGDEGHRPKPDPLPYLTAVRRLGVPARSCVAVEDSARGVASARAAGCAVLHVSPAVVVPQAHAHVPSLSDVTVARLAALVSPATGRRRYAGAHSSREVLDPAVLPHAVEAEPPL